MDIEDVEKLEDEFDGVFLQAVLLHIPKSNIKNVLGKLLAKLKDRGHMYIAVKEVKPNGVEEEIKRGEDYGYPYERFFSYFTLDEIKDHLQSLKMRTVYENITSSRNTRWIQVIGQK